MQPRAAPQSACGSVIGQEEGIVAGVSSLLPTELVSFSICSGVKMERPVARGRALVGRACVRAFGLAKRKHFAVRQGICFAGPGG